LKKKSPVALLPSSVRSPTLSANVITAAMTLSSARGAHAGLPKRETILYDDDSPAKKRAKKEKATGNTVKESVIKKKIASEKKEDEGLKAGELLILPGKFPGKMLDETKTMSSKKAKKSGDDDSWKPDSMAEFQGLTEDEKLLVSTGRGRRGEPLETPLGWCYFSDDHETCLGIGQKIGVEPLLIYSMNRWAIPKLTLRDELMNGSRLWIDPNEDWEADYIAEDRKKALNRLYDRIQAVFPDFVKGLPPLRDMRKAEFKDYTDSGTFYEKIMQTFKAAEETSKENVEHMEDLKLLRVRFDEKWLEIGFLPPHQIVQLG
jgi:hypothetical protein